MQCAFCVGRVLCVSERKVTVTLEDSYNIWMLSRLLPLLVLVIGVGITEGLNIRRVGDKRGRKEFLGLNGKEGQQISYR